MDSIPTGPVRASRRAPSLIVLKVLDDAGHGRISDVIAALDYVVANKRRAEHPCRQPVGRDWRVRVLHIGPADAGGESGRSKPASSSSRRPATTAATRPGVSQYGGITAPGNAPVGADGRRLRATWARWIAADDTMAPFSSRGPTAIDFAAKPDIVAPGVGIESLSDPTARSIATQRRTCSTAPSPTSYLPYLSLSGTSMSAPVVDRHRGADAAGEPGADAERGEGDPPVHRRRSTRATTR